LLEYYCEAAIKNVLTYTNGSPDGYAKLYHENGKISEEGMYMWDTQVEN
jgi:antitoxin component YwqK of YwqJK toxin-antitoxin module